MEENNEKSISASNMLTSMSYKNWVIKIHSNAKIPDKVWGKSLTYHAFDNNKLIGLLNIRYELNNDTRMKYGDIGYSVKPSERKKGYATKMLEYALKECKRLNMKKVILGCYKGNIGSAKTIIKNGGVLVKEEIENLELNPHMQIEVEKQYYEIKINSD